MRRFDGRVLKHQLLGFSFLKELQRTELGVPATHVVDVSCAALDMGKVSMVLAHEYRITDCCTRLKWLSTAFEGRIRGQQRALSLNRNNSIKSATPGTLLTGTLEPSIP